MNTRDPISQRMIAQKREGPVTYGTCQCTRRPRHNYVQVEHSFRLKAPGPVSTQLDLVSLSVLCSEKEIKV